MRRRTGSKLIIVTSVLVLLVVVVVVGRIPPTAESEIASLPAMTRRVNTTQPSATATDAPLSETATDAPPLETATATILPPTHTPSPHAGKTKTPRPAEQNPTRQATAEPTPTPSRIQQVTIVLGEKGWQIVPDVDLNDDGRNNEILAYIPAEMPLARDFSDPMYDEYQLLATSLAILQQTQQTQQSNPLRLLLKITPQGITAGEQSLLSFALPASSQFGPPTAFLTTYNPEGPIHVTVIPVSNTGERYMQSIGLAWNEEEAVYRLVLSVRRPGEGRQ